MDILLYYTVAELYCIRNANMKKKKRRKTNSKTKKLHSKSAKWMENTFFFGLFFSCALPMEKLLKNRESGIFIQLLVYFISNYIYFIRLFTPHNFKIYVLDLRFYFFFFAFLHPTISSYFLPSLISCILPIEKYGKIACLLDFCLFSFEIQSVYCFYIVQYGRKGEN